MHLGKGYNFAPVPSRYTNKPKSPQPNSGGNYYYFSIPVERSANLASFLYYV